MYVKFFLFFSFFYYENFSFFFSLSSTGCKMEKFHEKIFFFNFHRQNHSFSLPRGLILHCNHFNHLNTLFLHRFIDENMLEFTQKRISSCSFSFSTIFLFSRIFLSTSVLPMMQGFSARGRRGRDVRGNL